MMLQRWEHFRETTNSLLEKRFPKPSYRGSAAPWHPGNATTIFENAMFAVTVPNAGESEPKSMNGKAKKI